MGDYTAYAIDVASVNREGVGTSINGVLIDPETLKPYIADAEAAEQQMQVGSPTDRVVILLARGELAAAGEAFRDWHLLVADDVTEERHQRPGAEHPGVILLRQGAGLRRTELLDTAQAGFASACDGDLSVAQLVNALDSLIGEGEEDFTDRLSEAVSRLLRHGLLRKM